MRSSVDLHHGFETVFYRGSASSSSAYWHSNAERKCLGWTLAEILWPSDLDVSRKENVLSTFGLLESLVVQSDPDHLFPGLEDPSFDNDSFALNVFVGFNVHLANNWFTLYKGRFVKTDPDFTLWRY